MFCFT